MYIRWLYLQIINIITVKWQWFLAIFPIIDHSQGHSSFSNPIQLVSIPCQTLFLFVNWSCFIFLWIALETWVLSTVMTGILYVTEAPPSIWSLLNEGNSARLWISAVWQGTRCVTFTFCARNDDFFCRKPGSSKVKSTCKSTMLCRLRSCLSGLNFCRTDDASFFKSKYN